MQKNSGFFSRREQTTVDSVFVHDMMPQCSLLITGNFKHESDLKKKFLEPLKLEKMDDDSTWSNNFKISKKDDVKLMVFDVCTYNNYGPNYMYKGAGIIVAIPTSASDLETSYHLMRNCEDYGDKNVIHAYLNLFAQDSEEYKEIEKMAKTLKFEQHKIPRKDAPTAEKLVELSIDQAKKKHKEIMEETPPVPIQESSCVIL